MNAIPAPKLDPREQHFRIASPRRGLQLFLRRLEPVRRTAGDARPVLYVHGGTFPSALSIAHRFDGYSWRDALCAAGFDVWGLDFHGFGSSDRYPEMDEPPEANAALCRATDAAEQLAAGARFILAQCGQARLALIAHSWGSLPTGLFASTHPDLVDRVVLFGPIARRIPPGSDEPPQAPAWRIVTLADQWSRFIEHVPADEPPVLSRAHFDEWGERYLDSDPGSRTRDPAGVRVPTGPFNDIRHAWHGAFPYDPAGLRAPVAIIRGEWDGVIPDTDARWLFDGFAAPSKRDIKIGHATHLMHLEKMRYALYRESIAFLQGGDQAPAP
ncbi:MAG TPA: alpha/beta fold hydrolase [Candidatus Acidoferrum sp.]|nr:alpha/beta fold hydrolase [Candidatus Acidoferrum sp.]